MSETHEKRVDETWKEKVKTQAQEDSMSETKTTPEGDFKFLITTLGMQAWIALGAMPNPITEKIEENLNQAKFFIDILSVIQEKTKGNLNKEESEILESLLYELRLAFVEKNK